MLDGLLGRGFSSKCKSLIKPTRTRIDVLRRRKEATQRFLKGNLAQLLSNGLDINAFGRTEEFLAGLNLLACYDFLEQSCEYILKKLSLMQKQSECPEECREAVGSLMFAAARFSDLPELRDLRDALQERYGSSLEHFVNQKFVERLAMKAPTIDKKIQLLQDIALELSIKWDSRGFQHRMMTNPSASALNQAKKQELIHEHDSTYSLRTDNETAIKSNKRDQPLKEKFEVTTDRLKANGENSHMRKDELGHKSFGRVQSTGNSGKLNMGSEQITVRRDNYDMSPQGRREKAEVSSDELQAKIVGEKYLMRKDELVHRSFGGVKSTGNDGKPLMRSEQNNAKRGNYDLAPHGRREKDELSSEEVRTKNSWENCIMRKDELVYRSFGEYGSTGFSRKPLLASEQGISKRDSYDMAPQGRREKSELSSNDLQTKYGSENNLVTKDVFGRAESTDNGNGGKSQMGNKHNTHYDITPVGKLEEDEFSSDRLRAKSLKDNYYTRKDELDHLSFKRDDSTGNSRKPHIGSERNTPRKEIYDIAPHHRRELDGDRNEPTRINGKEDSFQRSDGHGSSSCGKWSDVIDEQNTSQREIYDITPCYRREHTDDKNERTRINGNEDTVRRRERHGSSSHGKKAEVTDGIYEAQNTKTGFFESYDCKLEDLNTIRDWKNVSSASNRDYKERNAVKTPKVIQMEDADRFKPNSCYAFPPPYVKSKDKLVPPPYVKSVDAKKASPDTYKRDDVDRRPERIRPNDYYNHEELGHEKDVPYRDNIPLPKPRSIRRKHSKSSSNRDNHCDSEDSEAVKRSSSSRRTRDHHSKKGLQILFDEEHKRTDEEERKIDKLLLHYSKKPSAYDEEKVRRKMKSLDEGEASVLPIRSVSLPREDTNSKEQIKVYARANSFQPDKPTGHVHPKLPDYDDLAAQFAALKGR